MIKVVFFASLKERLGCDHLGLPFEAGMTVNNAKQKLIELNDEWQVPLSQKNLLASINMEMVNNTAELKAGDELAFFPPVTGG